MKFPITLVIFLLISATTKLSWAAEVDITYVLPKEVEEHVVEQVEEEVIEEEWKDPLLVSLEEFGELRGFEEVSANGKTFYSFTGIPYAHPPVGDKRFKDPAPIFNVWEGTRNFTEMPEACPQFDVLHYMREPFPPFLGKEDCLYLNVYAPKPHSRKLLPVLIFLHGGAYISGGAAEYLPHHLLNEEVVVVVMQFRLGVLGYLSTEDLVMPGNLGLKDQNMAFRWINRYIESFGGDSFKNTLFGNSAGGAMAHLQSLSHHNLGFFKRAILQSGNALCPWAMGGVHREAAFYMGRKYCTPKAKPEQEVEKVAEPVQTNGDVKPDSEIGGSQNTKDNEKIKGGEGTQNDGEVNKESQSGEKDGSKKDGEREEEVPKKSEMTSEELLECLQNVDVETLAMSAQDFFSWTIFPFIFGPYVDGRFLVASPEWLLKEQRHKRMELIVGISRDDGGMITNGMYANDGRRNIMKTNFPQVGPISMEFTNGDVAPLNMTIKAFDRYIGGIKIEEEDADNWTKLFTDRHFAVPSENTAFFHHKNNLAKKKSVYYYQLHHKGQRSLTQFFESAVGENWINHADELFYLFPSFGGDKDYQMSDDDKKVSETIIKMWVNFANTGNPTPEGSELGFTWDPFTTDSPRHLAITTQPKMEDDNRAEAREFWNSLPTRQNIQLFEDKFPQLSENLKNTVDKVDESETAPPTSTNSNSAQKVEL